MIAAAVDVGDAGATTTRHLAAVARGESEEKSGRLPFSV